MKLAFISDIHSNIYALKSVLKELESYSPSDIYCLGDLVGFLPFCKETLNEIKKNGIISIAGNYDLAVANDKKTCGCSLNSSFEDELSRKSLEKTKKDLDDNEKNFLRKLKTNLLINNNKTNKKHLYLFHGLLDNTSAGLEDGTSEEKFNKVIDKSEADIYLFGHVHKPYIKKVRNKAFVNCGSVGKSMEPGYADYVLIDLNNEKSTIQIMRAGYDLARMKKAFMKSTFPKEIIETWY